MKQGQFGAVFVTILLAAAACTPFQQPFGTPYRSPELRADAVLMADATRLPIKVWKAEMPTAILLGVHGFNDYSNAFALAGPWFADQDVTVYAYDQRGFGAAPAAGVWGGSEALTSDLASITRLLRAQHPGLPIFVVGASMGGAVTLAASHNQQLEADGLILAAPAVWGWSSMSLFLKAPLWVGAHTLPSYTLTGQGLERWPSDNIDMLRELGRDPLVIKETRIDAIYGLVGLMDEAFAAVDHVSRPVLLLYGDKDEIVPRGPVEQIAEKFNAPLTFKTYVEGWHMLLRDQQRETVWQDMLNWMVETKRAAERPDPAN